MKKLEFVAIGLVLLFMATAVLGKVYTDLIHRNGDIEQRANTIAPQQREESN